MSDVYQIVVPVSTEDVYEVRADSVEEALMLVQSDEAECVEVDSNLHVHYDEMRVIAKNGEPVE